MAVSTTGAAWCDVSFGFDRGWVYAGNLEYPYAGSARCHPLRRSHHRVPDRYLLRRPVLGHLLPRASVVLEARLLGPSAAAAASLEQATGVSSAGVPAAGTPASPARGQAAGPSAPAAAATGRNRSRRGCRRSSPGRNRSRRAGRKRRSRSRSPLVPRPSNRRRTSPRLRVRWNASPAGTEPGPASFVT